jgi:hypothetical protein
VTRTLKTIGPALLACAVAACSNQNGGVNTPSGEPAQLQTHGQRMHRDGEPQNLQAATAGDLKYLGGPVISNVKIVAVNWNANVDATIKNGFPGFYQAVVQSELFSWLDSEYNTTINANSGSHSGQPGTGQHIGNGTYGGQFTLTQTSSNVQDVDIQTALQGAIDSGAVPQPDTNTIYMVHFPPNTLITGSDGSQSCTGTAQYLFCAYHSTFVATGGLHVKYGVLPDTSSDCNSGCGNDASYFNNGTSVASHELIEAVTDPDVGLADLTNGYSYPCAWGGSGEIGDLCNAQQAQIAATQPNGTHYVVQKEFDNTTGQCILTKAVSGAWSLSASPSSVSVQAPGSGSATISASTTSPAQTVALSVSGAPAGVTAALSASSISTGASATLNLSVASSVAAGNYTLTISGTTGSTSHTASLVLVVTSGNSGNTIFSDGFESGGWNTSSLSSSGAWTVVTSSSQPSISAHGGTHWADFNSYTSQAGATARIARASSFAIPGTYASVGLTFWVYHDTGYSSSADTVQAQVSTDGTTWSSVGTSVPRYNGTTGWAQASADLSAYKGQSVYLAFLGTSQYGNDVYLDDVTVTGSGTGPSTWTVSGTITSSGAGLAGVAVSAGSAQATTSSSGAFTLSGLANGAYTVTPSLSGYTFSPASQSVTVSGANVSGINFTATSNGGGGTLVSDGFENGGWTATQLSGTGGAWSAVSTSKYPSISAHGGSKFADFNSYTSASGSQTRYARTATIVVPSNVTTVTLKFWMYHDTGYSTDADKVQPQVAVSGTWSNVGSAVARYSGSTGWAQATVDLSAYKGKTIQLGFVGISAYGNDEYLDDVTVTAQ